MGYLADVQMFYEMSKDWYRGRPDESWDPLDPTEAMALWERHGFTGDFWKLA